MSFGSVLHILGRLCLVFAGLLLLPLAVVLVDGSWSTGAAWDFVAAAGISIATGLSLAGMGGAESISSMITCLAGVGPGLGAVGPTSNFAPVGDGSKLLLMVAMLLGRLEYFAVLVLFSPLAWRR